MVSLFQKCSNNMQAHCHERVNNPLYNGITVKFSVHSAPHKPEEQDGPVLRSPEIRVAE